jgi:transcription antitermination factor NusG
MTLDTHWYAVKVRVGAERMAVMALTYHGVTSYWPHITRTRQYADRAKTVDVSLMPGYLFCKVNAAVKTRVLSTAGVNGIVSLGSHPTPIPDREIEAVRRAVEAGGRPAPRPQVGSRVRVLGGPLTGLEGVLIRDANQSQLLVSVELLRRSVSVSIDSALVEHMCVQGKVA